MMGKFKQGDRVSHIGRQENGTVIRADHDLVVVEFDARTPRGNPSVGEFDRLWFETHENWLRPMRSDPVGHPQ